MAKYRGKFDDGWDAYREKVFARQKELGGIFADDVELSRHDPDVARWDDLSADEQRLYARMMEVFAGGYFEHVDHQIGRLIDYLESTRQLDNTLVMLVSDNGASARVVHTGRSTRTSSSTTCPMTCSRISTRSMTSAGRSTSITTRGAGRSPATPPRSGGGSAKPIAAASPTASSYTGRPESRPKANYVNNIAMSSTWCPRCSMLSHRSSSGNSRRIAISHRRGQPGTHIRRRPSSVQASHAVLRDVRAPFDLSRRLAGGLPVSRSVLCGGGGAGFGAVELTEDKLRELDATGWELYHVDVDPTETKNLAESERPRLVEMIALWYTEAGKYHVLPLDSRGTMRFADPRPQISAERESYVYFPPGTQAVPENTAVKVLNRAHSITAEAELAENDNGVIVCQGSNIGGYTMFVQDGLLHYVHNYVGAQELHVVSNAAVAPGRHTLRYEFVPTGPPDLLAGRGYSRSCPPARR